jgi:hypothetical protein
MSAFGGKAEIGPQSNWTDWIIPLGNKQQDYEILAEFRATPRRFLAFPAAAVSDTSVCHDDFKTL